MLYFDGALAAPPACARSHASDPSDKIASAAAIVIRLLHIRPSIGFVQNLGASLKVWLSPKPSMILILNLRKNQSTIDYKISTIDLDQKIIIRERQ
ncbi:MAG: hypothetical protein WAK63_15235, partial [Xanthobacteraceae bacterium]